MMLGARTGAWGGKPLPYLRRVEYLKSHGTEWICTGVNTKQTLKIRSVFETNSTVSYYVYGVRFENSTITCASGSSISDLHYGVARWGESARTQVVPSGLVDIIQDSSGVIINGSSYSYDYKQTVIERSGYTMVLFAARNGPTTVASNMVGKIYYCAIWDDDVLVRDFIPVRFTNDRGETEGAMYDRVSGQIFGNQGTGAFIIGPDKTT